jgi:uncharacterized protein
MHANRHMLHPARPKRFCPRCLPTRASAAAKAPSGNVTVDGAARGARLGLGTAPCRTLAALHPSVVVLAGVSLAGQTLAPGTLAFSGPSLLGAGIGAAIGLPWMSEHTTRYEITAILLFAGLRLLLR